MISNSSKCTGLVGVLIYLLKMSYKHKESQSDKSDWLLLVVILILGALLENLFIIYPKEPVIPSTAF